jgi:hypothetical protein
VTVPWAPVANHKDTELKSEFSVSPAIRHSLSLSLSLSRQSIKYSGGNFFLLITANGVSICFVVLKSKNDHVLDTVIVTTLTIFKPIVTVIKQ